MTEQVVQGGLQELTRRQLDELRPDPRNPRQHPDEQVEAIARSMAEHGVDQPLVVRAEDGTLIKGEGRWRAAKELGWETMPVVELDEDEEAALRRNLADHGAVHASYLDERVLMKLLEEVGAAGTDGGDEVAGFTEEFVESLRMALETAPEGEDGGPAEWELDEEWEARAQKLADQYKGSVVKQVVLIYDTNEYERVLGVLDAVMEETEARNHTEAATWLLNWWLERQSAEGGADE